MFHILSEKICNYSGPFLLAHCLRQFAGHGVGGGIWQPQAAKSATHTSMGEPPAAVNGRVTGGGEKS